MMVRGVRGATSVDMNEEGAILLATRNLLEAILEANPKIKIEDLASAWFTTTPDLTAVHPAKAARQLGWKWVPLMCSMEIPVAGGLERCIRVLLHWNTELPSEAIRHIYLGEAKRLRPDLVADIQGERE